MTNLYPFLQGLFHLTVSHLTFSIWHQSSAKRTATQSLVTAKLKERNVFERFCL